MTESSAKRTQKWDILRFVMIFFVVLGHFAEFYTDSSQQMRSLFVFIYTFHMPVFIFVSGLFSKKTVNERNKDKLFGYLILYLLFKSVALLYRTIAGKAPEIIIFSENGLPWFMFALFAFTLLTSFIKEYSPKFILPFFILFACIAGYDRNIGDFLSLSRIITYYPFFYAGYCIDRKKLEAFCDGRARKIISAIAVIAFAVIVFASGDRLYWLRPLLSGRNSFSTLGPNASAYGFFIRLIYYAVVAAVCLCIIIITPDKTPFGIAGKAGQRTLAVYGFHYIFVYLMYNVFSCKEIFDKYIPGKSEWIIIPISLAITLLLSAKPLNDMLTFFMSVPQKVNK